MGTIHRVGWLLVVCSCGGGGGGDDGGPPDGPPGGMATGTARMLNGPSPGAVQTASFAAASAADGHWQLSPTGIRAPITAIQLDESVGNVTVPLADCIISFDLTQPGLSQSVECPFTLPAGTYVGAGPVYGDTFDALVDDDVNGLYTDPDSATMMSTTPPVGGARYITLPNPRGPGFGVQITKFATPFVVAAGDTVTFSVLLSALQFFQVTVAGATVSLGVDGNGMPGFPNAVAAVGTPAAIAYYVDPGLGSAYSYVPTQGVDELAIGVLYSNDSTPAFLSIRNSDLPGCGPLRVGFLFPGQGNGYLGLDSSGVLGWAGFSDPGVYSAVMSMPALATLGDTTPFKCLDTTTDPAPAGDSFSSGAPDIPNPTYSDTMTLVAN